MSSQPAGGGLVRHAIHRSRGEHPQLDQERRHVAEIAVGDLQAGQQRADARRGHDEQRVNHGQKEQIPCRRHQFPRHHHNEQSRRDQRIDQRRRHRREG